MTREEVVMVLGILKTAYPNFYRNMTKEEGYGTIELWSDMFKGDDTRLVTVSVKELINSFKYPPTIADIKEQMMKLTTKKADLTEEWNALQRAIGNSLYNSEESFNKLPDIAKRFAGSPSQLREMATMDSDVVHSVVKGQFFKQAEILQKRDEEEKRMLPETKKLREMIGSIGKDVNLLES